MGQKVNPHGLRVGVIKEWDSRWYADKKHFGDTLVEDYNLREFIKDFKLPAGEKGGRNNAPKDGAAEAPKAEEKKTNRQLPTVPMASAGIARIEIERLPQKVRINIHCAKPGLVIGRSGAGIEALRAAIAKKFGMDKKDLALNIIEIKNMDLSAQLVAEKIAADLENRVSFRRAMKGSIGRTMKSGAKGIKIKCGGRLGGAEIARSECYHEGTIPLQTIRADIDYGFAEANTTYGRIGIKVWIYKGEILKGDAAKAAERQDRRDNRRGDRRGRDDRRRRDDRSSGERRQRRDFGGERGERRPRGDRPQGQNRREGGNANAASKES